jgi:hypothetical protein
MERKGKERKGRGRKGKEGGKWCHVEKNVAGMLRTWSMQEY